MVTQAEYLKHLCDLKDLKPYAVSYMMVNHPCIDGDFLIGTYSKYLRRATAKSVDMILVGKFENAKDEICLVEVSTVQNAELLLPKPDKVNSKQHVIELIKSANNDELKAAISSFVERMVSPDIAKEPKDYHETAKKMDSTLEVLKALSAKNKIFKLSNKHRLLLILLTNDTAQLAKKKRALLDFYLRTQVRKLTNKPRVFSLTSEKDFAYQLKTFQPIDYPAEIRF